ncbi:MAG: lamin tail domain-containing protein [Prevotellaceae bacterium]|jgi:hypothetical protein|nr:lamin tail domain-containing protein [Prevotellaceae bacterium]
MKKIIFLSLLGCALNVQAQYVDSFSDGNFTDNPAWSGTDSKFIIQDAMLCLNDLSASGTSLTACLSTPSAAGDSAVFSCRIQILAQATSGNYVRFYLISDTADLTAPLNGYFIMAGGTSKEVSLYRQQGNTRTKIIDGADGRLSSSVLNDVEVKATRANGEWTLFSKLAGDTDFVLEGSCMDSQVKRSVYSGIFVYYSSGNKDKYRFDDFFVTGKPYTPVEQPVSLNDIIFNEIMPDPDPPVSLPNVEYIELYNRTGNAIDLSGWTIAQDAKVGVIQQGSIAPDGYLLLCPQTQTAAFAPFGNVAAVTSFPTLVNAGGLLTLATADGELVCWVDYTDKWFENDTFRKEGGWSLERVDTDNLMNDLRNWHPSSDLTGGTPARQNSVARDNPDVLLPEITAVAFDAGNRFIIRFSKPMNDSLLSITANYYSEQVRITAAEPVTPKNDAVVISLDRTLPAGEEALITVQGLECISGYVLPDSEVRITVPQEISVGDVVINELLFNPVENCPSYVELFNVSDKTLDLSTLYLTRRRNGTLESKFAVSTDRLLFSPKQYLLITPDVQTLCTYYPCPQDGFFVAATLPLTPNTEGNITLILTNGTEIDEFSYHEQMHHPFVTNPKGVSLERINPFAPTQDTDNWHSASFEAGYGTPALQNSQYHVAETQTDAAFSIEYTTFTPDNDGFRDMLYLHYQLPQSGYLLNLIIYDPSGVPVRRLCNNTLLALNGVIAWDGTADNGTLCPVGIYVLVPEATHPHGDRITTKIVCVSGAK